MPKLMHYLLLALGIIVVVVLFAEIGLSIAATQHDATPAKTIQGNVGPYALILNLYTYPAHAGFALPFTLAPQPGTTTALTYDVTSVPGPDIAATPVHGSVAADRTVPGGVQGTVEITVQGQWYLKIVVNGPAGRAEISVPITATAPAAIPLWLGWLIGFIPIFGLGIFLAAQRSQHRHRGDLSLK